MGQMSAGEKMFLDQCDAVGLRPEQEFVFAAPRKWRADFAFPNPKILVEIEGGSWIAGRHSRGSGFAKDCEKYNAAALLGYRVLRFTPQMVKDGTALTTTLEMLKQ